MSKFYFQKESMSSKFILAATGKAIPFEFLDGNQGVTELDDADPQQKIYIDALNKAAGTRGIVKLTEGEYREKKTLHPFNEQKHLSRHRQDGIVAFPSANQPPIPKKPGVVAAGKPQLNPSKLTRASIQAAEQAMQSATASVANTPDAMDTVFKPATGRAAQKTPAA